MNRYSYVQVRMERKMKKIDSCKAFIIDEKRIEKIKNAMKPKETFMHLAETFKVLGEPTRLKILYAMAEEELCVCEVTMLLGMTQSAVSHQLRILRNMRLVKYRKEGRSVFYSLDDDHIRKLFKQGLDHVEESN